jgi:hypothetical protein
MTPRVTRHLIVVTFAQIAELKIIPFPHGMRASTDSRRYMWLNIEHNLCFDHLSNEWRFISNAPNVEKFCCLLGYCKADWDVKCEAMLDRFVRLYIMSSAAKRKARVPHA